MTGLTEDDINHFVQPSSDKLEDLGAGCYVRVHDAGMCFWAEITQRDGKNFCGRVHKELATPGCNKSKASIGKDVYFTEEKIVLLGCDNYCWC